MKQAQRHPVVLSLALVSLCIGGCARSQVAHTLAPTEAEVVLASDVVWGALNPARGEKGPRAANLWGDRTADGATGFLVKFADGFSSPPHIHNVTYRGMVISGLVHNDDPKAAETWMPTGSFWTQPAGELHITSAKGDHNVAYIEIESGPYLVRPAEQAFDNGERAINVDAANIVWLDASNTTWIKPGSLTRNGPQLAHLWGQPQNDHAHGSLIKLPAGFTGHIRARGSTFRAVVIQGRPTLHLDAASHASANTPLEPGSYFGANDASTYPLTCNTAEPCLIYVRTVGTFEVVASAIR